MEIEIFLLSNLVDIYCSYCQYVLKMEASDFDIMFEDENGQEMSDLDFIKEKSKDIFTDEIFDGVYSLIIDFDRIKEIDVDKVLSCLISKFFLYNYSSMPSVISYLKNTSFEDIKKLFFDNYDFGLDLVKSYYYSLINQRLCDDNREKIYNNHDQEILLKYELNYSFSSFKTLNDLLREYICKIYNYYINYGYDDIDALNTTWEFFFRDIDPIGNFNEFCESERTKAVYKFYLLNLIYADLYEDICNNSIIDSENYDDRLANVIPVLSVQMGNISIPLEVGTRNRILKHFILLQDEKEKIKENRKKTYSDGRIKELKNVNPFYILDELK